MSEPLARVRAALELTNISLIASEKEIAELKADLDFVTWSTRRMLQALDAYWLHCDGLPKGRHPRGRYGMENWWYRFEKYRYDLEDMLDAS